MTTDTNPAMARANRGDLAYNSFGDEGALPIRPPLSRSPKGAQSAVLQEEMVMMDEDDLLLSRPQRRSLRRIYNGRSVPIVADGRSFLTYKQARQYLQSLTPEARDAAYAEMRGQAE